MLKFCNRFVLWMLPLVALIACNPKESADNKFLHHQIDSASEQFFSLYDSNKVLAENSVHWLVKQSKAINYTDGEAKALARLSYIFEQNGVYDSALFYNLQSLELRRSMKDTLSMVMSYINLARNYNKLKLQQSQRRCLQTALIYLKRFPSAEELYETYSQWAIYHVANEHFDSAKQSFNTALKLVQKTSDTSLLAKALVNYANILNQLDEVDSALYYYRKGLTIYQRNKALVSLSGIYNNIALVYWDKENRDSTEFYLKKGYEQTRLLGNKRDHENNVLNLIDFWNEQGNLEKSNRLLQELISLKDSVFEENLHQTLAGIELNYAVKLRQEENETLKYKLNQKNTLRNAAILLSLLIALFAFFLLRFYRQKRLLALKEKKLAEHEIDQLLKQRELQKLDAMFEGRETERKRIGRDLHDRLGSILSTVKLYFSAMEDRINALKSENTMHYKKASDLLDEAVNEVRRISQDLVSGVLVKNGLMAALFDLKNSLEPSGKIKIAIFEAGIPIRLKPEVEIELYRIIQELISNTLKHSEATNMNIHLSHEANQFTVMVEDNGKGFDASVPVTQGLGIANIRQRVALLGGAINFDSKPGAGTTVIIELETNQTS